MQSRRSNFVIAVFSTQFITTLSAISYLVSRSYENALIRIYSLRHPSFELHTKLILDHLFPWCESRGFSCELLFLEDDHSHSLKADLLITPHIDHRRSIAFIQRLQPAVVVETGESIGVEPRLYSLRARFQRRRLLRWLPTEPFLHSLVLAHTVSLSGCNLSRLHTFLEICADLKAPLAESLDLGNTLAIQRTQSVILLLFPYLTYRKQRKLFRKVLRRLRRRLGIMNASGSDFFHPTIRHVAELIARRNSGRNSSHSGLILVKPHPKNHFQVEAICNALLRHLGQPPAYSVRSVPADVPLEQLVAALPGTAPLSRLQILGFGTNLLAAKIFLYPLPVAISQVEMGESGTLRVFLHLYDFVVHRTEFLRKRHVSRLMASLDEGLELLHSQSPPERRD